MLDDVIFALHQVEDFPGATMMDVRGVGRGMHQHVKEKRERPSFGYPTAVRVEIVCTDALVETLVETIEKNAHTGRPGDGKVFVSPVESALRISNGQRNDEAL
jgi:nitrogen regulatory protein PII